MENQIKQKTTSRDDFGQELLPERNDVKQTVTILLSNKSPQIKKSGHCFNCGRIVCQYYSEVRVIIIGEMREVQRPIDIFCSRCKWLYRIG